MPAKVSFVRISGSGTCLPLLRILGVEFEKRNPQTRLRFLPGMHSGGGIKGVTTGVLDVGAVSRPLQGDEKGLGLKHYILSTDALAVGTNRTVRLRSVTEAQLRDIYSGRTDNWKALGLKPGSIVVLDRNEDESAKIILRKYVLGPAPKFPVSKKAVVLFFEKDMITGLQSTPGSIGYFSAGFAISERLPINIVRLDGVYPSVRNVLAGRYRMVRPLGVVTTVDPKPAALDFIKFAQSPEGRRIMIDNGFAPAE